VGLRGHGAGEAEQQRRPEPSDAVILAALAALSHLPALVKWAFPGLVSYAAAFFLIPAARALWAYLWANPRIRKRNLQRRARVAELVAEAVSSNREKRSLAQKHQKFQVIC